MNITQSGTIMNKLTGSHNEGTLFYHYSLTPHTQLESKNHQLKKGFKTSLKPIADTAVRYEDNISLFLEPPPLDIIGSLFKNHPFWKSGNVLYEHVIHANDLPVDLYFEIVETHYRDEYRRNNTILANRDFATYLKGFYDHLVKAGVFGQGRVNFIRACKEFLGTTRAAYIKTTKANPTSLKYAANVPHAMVYPKSGTLPVRSVSKVTID